jgi:hypothetical protein
MSNQTGAHHNLSRWVRHHGEYGAGDLALNGGPTYKFSPAIFLGNCETQEEGDEYWEKLSAVAKNYSVDGWKMNTESRGRSSPPF